MQGGETRSKSSSKNYLLNLVFLSKIYMKAFILGARSLRYPVGLAFIPLGVGRGGQNLVYLQKVVFLCQSFLKSISQPCIIKHSYLDHRSNIG